MLPYYSMFGPDKCGATDKVHFILQHRNPVSGVWEEKHLADAPRIRGDKKHHVYTLALRPSDSSYEIYIDTKSESKGSLLEAMTPPINPPEMIDDPSDHKPADWVDEATIADPTATKPEDWDEDAPLRIPDEHATKPDDWSEDTPLLIADPEAEQPENWDEEEDGIYEAPQVRNPECESLAGCGPWHPPMIANPEWLASLTKAWQQTYLLPCTTCA
eukprot:5102-Heterococcus_DN1.PRE.3